MKLIIVAMIDEIEEILKNDNSIKQIKNTPFKVFKNTNFIFAISGIGMLNANICLSYILTKYIPIKHIYNIGFAGALNTNLKSLQVVSVSLSYDYFNNKKYKLINDIYIKNDNIRKAVALTSDFFIDSNIINKIKGKEKLILKYSLFKNINLLVDIVDMELASYCFVAEKYHISISSIKVISDVIDKQGTTQYDSNVVQCKKILNNIYKKIMLVNNK